MKSYQKMLEKWNESTTDREKQQHAYLVLAVVSLVVAGVVGLVHYELGQKIVGITLLAVGLFVGNMLAWALIEGLVLTRFSKPDTKKPKTATKKSKKK